MSLKKIAEHPISSALIAAFIIWVATLLFPTSRDFWLRILASVWKATAGAGRWAWADVTVPRVVFWFLLLFPVAVVGVFAVAAFWPQLPPKRERTIQEELEVSDDEMKVLQALAERDGDSLWFNQVKGLLDASQLRTQHVVMMLSRKQLIEFLNDVQYGGTCHLTAKGRAACVLMGWAK